MLTVGGVKSISESESESSYTELVTICIERLLRLCILKKAVKDEMKNFPKTGNNKQIERQTEMNKLFISRSASLLDPQISDLFIFKFEA